MATFSARLSFFCSCLAVLALSGCGTTAGRGLTTTQIEEQQVVQPLFNARIGLVTSNTNRWRDVYSESIPRKEFSPDSHAQNQLDGYAPSELRRLMRKGGYFMAENPQKFDVEMIPESIKVSATGSYVFDASAQVTIRYVFKSGKEEVAVFVVSTSANSNGLPGVSSEAYNLALDRNIRKLATSLRVQLANADRTLLDKIDKEGEHDTSLGEDTFRMAMLSPIILLVEGVKAGGSALKFIGENSEGISSGLESFNKINNDMAYMNTGYINTDYVNSGSSSVTPAQGTTNPLDNGNNSSGAGNTSYSPNAYTPTTHTPVKVWSDMQTSSNSSGSTSKTSSPVKTSTKTTESKPTEKPDYGCWNAGSLSQIFVSTKPTAGLCSDKCMTVTVRNASEGRIVADICLKRPNGGLDNCGQIAVRPGGSNSWGGEGIDYSIETWGSNNPVHDWTCKDY